MVNSPYVTNFDLQGDCSSKVMVPNESNVIGLYMSSYLPIIVAIGLGLSGTTTEI